MSKILATLVLARLLAPSPALAGDQPLDLPGDVLSMAELGAGPGRAGRLAAFTADDARPIRGRALNWIVKRPPAAKGEAATFGLSAREAVPTSAAAFDACRLDRAKPEAQLLYVDAEGIVAAGPRGVERLIKTATLFAYARDDALPRIKLCFDLFPNEAPALLIPRLEGIEIWRARTPLRYERHALLPVDAQLRFSQALAQRGLDPATTQRVGVSLDLPSVTAIDFNADGLPDLCLCRESRLACHVQDRAKGYAPRPTQRQLLTLLSPAEEKDSSLRVDCRFADLNGDRRADFLVQKAYYSVGDMRASLSIFPQQANGAFPARPAQALERSGYFAFQELFDLDGDALPELVAPVTPLSWTDIAGIYLARAADIEFVSYKNLGGRFATQSASIHQLRYPIDLKNWQAIVGSLPLWNIRFRDLPKERRQVLFFPERKAAELYVLDGGSVGGSPVWRHEADLGTEAMRVDLDGDGFDEVVFAYGRDPQRSRRLLFLEPKER